MEHDPSSSAYAPPVCSRHALHPRRILLARSWTCDQKHASRTRIPSTSWNKVLNFPKAGGVKTAFGHLLRTEAPADDDTQTSDHKSRPALALLTRATSTGYFHSFQRPQNTLLATDHHHWSSGTFYEVSCLGRLLWAACARILYCLARLVHW